MAGRRRTQVVKSAGGVVVRVVDGAPHVLLIRDPYEKWEIHKFATFYLMFSVRGDPIPERAEGITEVEWVRLGAAHDRISYPNATGVVRVAQDVLLDETAKKSQTEPAHG